MRRAVLAVSATAVLAGLAGTAPALATSIPLPSVQVSNDDDVVGVGVSDGTGGGVGVGVKKDGSGVCTNGLRYGGPYCITP
ncbi:MAG: hypothetical protein M3P04_03725 [Actinomycetota bacterium]|nr:hypothetical protein [Actinomycetota bacterium]